MSKPEVVVVTGASAGVGRAVVRRFARVAAARRREMEDLLACEPANPGPGPEERAELRALTEI